MRCSSHQGQHQLRAGLDMSAGGVYPKLPARLAVRDGLAEEEDEDEELSDIDDEVFIRDGKHGILKLGGHLVQLQHDDEEEEECGAKRPLMPPRRKSKAAHLAAGGQDGHQLGQLPWRTLFAPICYTLLGFLLLMGIIALCFIAIARMPVPDGIVGDWLAHERKPPAKAHLVPCTSLISQLQWTRTLPKLTSEAPLRSNDVNGDSVADVIVGFSTGLDTSGATDFACKLYFDQNAPCLGGVLALDGKTGETIWTHWTAHAIFSVDCGLDLNGDKIKDCIVAGRGGILHAINGQDGTSIWELPYRDLSMLSQQKYYDIYDARYIADMDDDGIGDVVASHTWQSDGSQSEVILVSGKNGNKINSMDFPGKEQLFVAPQVIVHPDGETYLILVASDQQKSGGLYIIPHSKLLKGEFKLQELYHGAGKGVSLPPLLIDINSDGTEDIIVAMFNSTIMAFDGLTFKEIWNFTIDNSEVISIPVPGYYNDDKVPDFMVKHQIGPGFPVYYYTTATVLDGKTGKPLIETPMEDTMSAQMSGLSVTVDGYGNDWFLHWSADCLNNEKAKDEYEFFKSPDTDADLCKLRFNSSLVTSLFAFSQHVGPPGLPLYRSEDWKKLEFNNSIDPRKAAEDYVNSHSEFGNAENGGSNRSPDQDQQSSDQNKNLESESFQKPDNFYPKTKDNKYDNFRGEQPSNNFLDKALDELSGNEWKADKWENDKYKENNVPANDNNYDDTYDDEEERLIASRQLNEIRLQRSEKNTRYINNDTNDVQNRLDPSMDYTNGQSKQNNYYSSLHFNRSSNAEDSSDYMNIPDIDFVDNLKEVEALTERKKREVESNNSALKQSESNKDSYSLSDASNRIDAKIANKKLRNPLAQMIHEYRVSKRSDRLARESSASGGAVPGMQRQPPTGILLPSLVKPDKKRSIDLVFSTYWLPASSTAFVLLPRDLECIRKAEEKSGGKFSAQEREAAASGCLASRGVGYEAYQEANDKENAKIALGQMTLYRMRLQCVCPEDMLPGQSCRDIAEQQSWPEHLGASVGGYFESLRG